MIKFQQVSKYYHTKQKKFTALHDVNLDIHQGEIFGIIGLSGAGKSTLLRCINALERPQQGKILIQGVDVLTLDAKKLRELRCHIGMIFQHFNLLSSRTVFENIAFPLEISHVKRKVIAEKVLAMAKLTDLEDKLTNYPSQLSGGQKQRVAIARALVNGSKILLCDEATSSLDPETTQSILALLKKIRRELGVTIVLISHEMQVIKTICDKVALMEHGEIVEQGDIAEIFTEPKTEIAKRFVLSTLPMHLPEHMQHKIADQAQENDLAVLRLWFLKESAKEAVIAHLIKHFYVDVNILQASLEYIRDKLMGIMIITIDADDKMLQNCVDYLIAQNIKVEVIGYVSRHELGIADRHG